METNGDFSRSCSPTESFVNQPCKHLKNYKALKGFTSYKVLHAYYVACIAKGSSKEKVQEVECSTCHRLASRIHACLYCIHFGCFIRLHIHQHAAHTNHCLAMDILSGNIFCFECRDYTYDEEFNAISRKQKEQAGEIRGTVVYIPWEPSKEEIPLLKRFDCKKLRNDSCIGLRGLFNLGLTCFMNCIIQVLVHTPLLRDYFLSDKHVRCEPEKTCEGCLMSDIFQEFYSGQSTPFSIEPLLFAIWNNVPDLSGYNQHDAQEFFTAILQAMHKCCRNPDELISDKNHCSCIIHQIFSGFSQSYILCLDCKNSSTQISAFWDVNLDFGGKKEKILLTTCEDSESKVFLTNLIERYTAVETVDSECGTCSSLERTIQVTLKKLPVVMCFHLKRLQDEHSKISSQVFFPEYLDVSPYTTEVDPNDFVSGKNIFTLFAVVCHVGKSQCGHYISYIRQHKDSWYRCDDILIEKVEINEVLNSEGYLLFYHKRILEYEFKK